MSGCCHSANYLEPLSSVYNLFMLPSITAGFTVSAFTGQNYGNELGDCVSGTDTVESEVEKRYIENTIDEFLWRQTEEKRNIFIRRYWYFDSIKKICKSTGYSQSKVKSMLYEIRQKLRKELEREGIEI